MCNEISKCFELFINMSSLFDSDSVTVLMGHFNCLCDLNYRSNNTNKRYRSSKLLSKIEGNAELTVIAVWGQVTPYTRVQVTSYVRLDRIYMSSSFLFRPISCTTAPVSFSYHCIVIVQIGENCRSRFQPQWAFWESTQSSSLIRNLIIVCR